MNLLHIDKDTVPLCDPVGTVGQQEIHGALGHQAVLERLVPVPVNVAVGIFAEKRIE